MTEQGHTVVTTELLVVHCNVDLQTENGTPILRLKVDVTLRSQDQFRDGFIQIVGRDGTV